MQIKLPGKDLEMGVFAWSLCVEPSLDGCLNTAFLFSIVLWDSQIEALLAIRAT